MHLYELPDNWKGCLHKTCINIIYEPKIFLLANIWNRFCTVISQNWVCSGCISFHMCRFHAIFKQYTHQFSAKMHDMLTVEWDQCQYIYLPTPTYHWMKRHLPDEWFLYLISVCLPPFEWKIVHRLEGWELSRRKVARDKVRFYLRDPHMLSAPPTPPLQLSHSLNHLWKYWSSTKKKWVHFHWRQVFDFPWIFYCWPITRSPCLM